jgi:hypothetical protein
MLFPTSDSLHDANNSGDQSQKPNEQSNPECPPLLWVAPVIPKPRQVQERSHPVPLNGIHMYRGALHEMEWRQLG